MGSASTAKGGRCVVLAVVAVDSVAPQYVGEPVVKAGGVALVVAGAVEVTCVMCARWHLKSSMKKQWDTRTHTFVFAPLPIAGALCNALLSTPARLRVCAFAFLCHFEQTLLLFRCVCHGIVQRYNKALFSRRHRDVDDVRLTLHRLVSGSRA